MSRRIGLKIKEAPKVEPKKEEKKELLGELRYKNDRRKEILYIY